MQAKCPLLLAVLLFSFSISAVGQSKTPDGISYTIIKKGAGDHPQVGEEIKFHYTISNVNGETLWSTRSMGAPDFIVLGQAKSDMGRARDNCFMLMEQGSQYRFEFPKAMMESANTAAQPGDFIIYEIELLGFGPPKPSGVALFQQIKQAQGLSAAVDKLQVLCNTRSQSYALREGEMNRLGYALLTAGEKDAAIAIFQMNIDLNPGSFNAYDSLGDAYKSKGDKGQAKACFEKALQINPDFEAAREKLRTL